MNRLIPLLTLAPLALGAGAFAAEPAPQGAFDPSGLDRSVEPCQDFYAFACGGWMKSHPIPPDQSRWGRFNELEEHNKDVLRGLLEKAALTKSTDPIDRRLGDLYGSCMDEAAAEKKGADPLKDDFAAIEVLKSVADLPALLARLHLQGVNAGFDFGSDQDFKDSTKVIAEFDQGGLGCPTATTTSRTTRSRWACASSTSGTLPRSSGCSGTTRKRPPRRQRR